MRVLITAGPTREPIDAVRFISNRSSGRLGVDVAVAAMSRGHDTTLLLGPVSVQPPESTPGGPLRIYRFESSSELKQLLEAHWNDHDGLIMAAAVCDYRPTTVTEGKLARDPSRPLTLTLEPTPDLVRRCAAVRRPGQWIIGFALEERITLEQRADAKMRAKGVDAIVANPLGTMEATDITAWWLEPDQPPRPCQRMSKREFARWLIERAEQLHQARHPASPTAAPEAES
ncbi:MAG: phosphopantothenoylcysteine decarboxylase [Phycisphaeraceae bacterium]|nr:phosphopantothenoylcysteine decarboxylase [Phycisphaeraceae bacterium]